MKIKEIYDVSYLGLLALGEDGSLWLAVKSLVDITEGHEAGLKRRIIARWELCPMPGEQ